MVEVHLYGKLRHYAAACRPGHDCVVALEPRLTETMASLLARAGIPVDEINHVFFNSKLLATRTRMAPFMGLAAHSDLFDWNLSVPVNNGDRIGLFGTDMAILSM
jgi:hypothetical protein